MSYSKLEILEKEIQKNANYIKKIEALVGKIKVEVLSRRNIIQELSIQMEGVKEQLIYDNIRVDDEFVTTYGYSNKIRRGDSVKVIRVNKKSVSIEVIGISENWLKYNTKENNRLGLKVRFNRKNINKLAFKTMETSIKRNEKLNSLIS